MNLQCCEFAVLDKSEAGLCLLVRRLNLREPWEPLESLKSLRTQSREGKDPGRCVSVWANELGKGGREIGLRPSTPESNGVCELTDRGVCLNAFLFWTRLQNDTLPTVIR
jgi:hypothetical protein